MGIIVSGFVGCGKTFLKNTYGDKIKIYDASDLSLDDVVDTVANIVNDYDIVFISSSELIRALFNEQNIDYDVFYPSKNRRGEFIENQVRKRTKPNEIRELDTNFEKWIEEIDADNSSNCYKHKLSKMGEFIGNSPIIMQYINTLKRQNNEQALEANNEEKNVENND